MGRKREFIRKLFKELRGREEDWNSYMAACEEDADLKSFDANVQSRTTKVISTLQNGGVSTDYVSEVIAYVKEINKNTVDAIMVYKDDITSGAWRSEKKKMMCEENFKTVVKEYINYSDEMLDFCCILDKLLKSARNSHFEIEQVIQQCELEPDTEGRDKYARVSEKLKSLKAAAHHYESAEKLLQKIHSLQEKNQGLIDKLKLEYTKLGEKRRSIRRWKKALNMIFITTVSAKFITAVTALAMAQPEIQIAAAIANTICPVIIAGHHWVLGLITEYEKGLENDKVILEKMEYTTTLFCMKELGDLKFLIDRVVNEIDAVLFHDRQINSAMEGQVENSIKNMKSKLDILLKKIEDLEKEGETWSSEVLKLRSEVMRSMRP